MRRITINHQPVSEAASEQLRRYVYQWQELKDPLPSDDPNRKFEVYPVEDIEPSDKTSNEVIWLLGKSALTPPFTVVGDINMTLRAVAGEGVLFAWIPGYSEENGITATPMSEGEYSGPGQPDSTEFIPLMYGDSYFYKSLPRPECPEFAVKDYCSPAFAKGDEVPAVHKPLLEIYDAIKRG